MSDSVIQLKLDRILSKQEQTLSKIGELTETTAAVIASMAVFNESIGTQTEVINRLAEALSEEDEGGELYSLIKSIAVSLKEIKNNGADIRVTLGRLIPAVAQAAQDGVLMALGDGVPIPPEAGGC